MARLRNLALIAGLAIAGQSCTPVCACIYPGPFAVVRGAVRNSAAQPVAGAMVRYTVAATCQPPGASAPASSLDALSDAAGRYEITIAPNADSACVTLLAGRFNGTSMSDTSAAQSVWLAASTPPDTATVELQLLVP